MAPIRCCFDQTAVWHSDAARGPSTPSFNHLVGVLQKVQRRIEAQGLRGLEINDEFEARRLHDGKIGRLFALEYACNVTAYFSPDLIAIGAVTHQTAGGDEFTPLVECRNPVTCRERH